MSSGEKMKLQSQWQDNHLEFMDASACRGLESLAKINEKHNLQLRY